MQPSAKLRRNKTNTDKHRRIYLSNVPTVGFVVRCPNQYAGSNPRPFR